MNSAKTPKPSTLRRRENLRPPGDHWRARLYDIIFEADSPTGKAFDIGLMVAILTSIAVVACETLPEYKNHRGLDFAEKVLTGLFTIEYLMRLVCVQHPFRYARSFWGIIDLLSFLPTYITPWVGGNSRSFVILRSIRLLRVFRVLKLWRMMNDADELAAAVWKARNKIVVFLCVVLVAVTISGTLMYHIEGIAAEVSADIDGVGLTQPAAESQFTSIPQAMYWAIVTMTTVGYGDIVPQTALGKMISAVLILLGYSLIIVPSTFVSAEYQTSVRQSRGDASSDEPSGDAGIATPNDQSPACHHCEITGHRDDAVFCFRCGERRL